MLFYVSFPKYCIIPWEKCIVHIISSLEDVIFLLWSSSSLANLNLEFHLECHLHHQLNFLGPTVPVTML